MKRKVPLLFGVLATLSLVVSMLHDSATTTPDVSTAETAVASGYRVDIDPATKQFVEPVRTPVDEKAGLESLSRSNYGLVEEPSPVPGGGIMVNLQGRFQNTFTAKTASDGSVVIECDTEDNQGEGE